MSVTADYNHFVRVAVDPSTELPLIAYATVDSLHHTISIGQFHDSDKYLNTLQLLELLPLSSLIPSQLTPATVASQQQASAGYSFFVGLDRVRVHQPAAEKLLAVLQRRLKELSASSATSYVEPVECKYSGFKREQADVERELERLVSNHTAIQSAARETAATAAAGAAISCMNLLADAPNVGRWRLEQLRLHDVMLLDSNAAAALNLFPQPGDTDKHASLFGLLDKGRTPMSSRLLRQRIKQPSMSLPEIERRQRQLGIFVASLPLRERVADRLRRFNDMNKLVNRFQKGKASLQHLVQAWQCIEKAIDVIHELEQYDGEARDELEAEFTEPMRAAMGECLSLRQLVLDTIDKEALRGYQYAIKPELDPALNAANAEVRQCERDMEREARRVEEQYGLDDDSVGVVDRLADSKGHLLRVSRKNEQQLRGSTGGVIHMQSNKQGYFFTTRRMRELSEQIKEAQRQVDERFKALEAEALSVAAEYMPSFEQLGVLVTELDLLVGFAHVCVNAPVPYVRPVVLEKEAGVLELKGSRHPCMEVLDGMSFIPNDVSMRRGVSHMQIITG
ncbi:MutS-like protein, partial [Xylographa carneopallida]|nr:MutS-like protein [Xylographa carneopallida]